MEAARRALSFKSGAVLWLRWFEEAKLAISEQRRRCLRSSHAIIHSGERRGAQAERRSEYRPLAAAC